MVPRLLFLLILGFWVAMNVLLWRVEYGSRGNGTPLPADLVWQKILTAPDASSLTVYLGRQKIGFCQISTSVEQAMAALEEDTLPPEGILKQAGYQIRFDGNVSVGAFTNRLTFNGRIQFSSRRAWREVNLKVTAHPSVVEVHSAATNQAVHLKITTDEVASEYEFTFAQLQNPDTLVRAIAGDWPGGWAAGADWMPLPQNSRALATALRWEAHLERLTIGREPVSVYRLETHVLDHPLVVYVSTLGEILRVELPGGITAVLDQIGGA
ncbi:MAG TPA: hypothetical protein VMB80_15240 [Candidatus Acidoferrum sp.]|nr:hypothetical protein [Candidatus Acidoferrum sp.]